MINFDHGTKLAMYQDKLIKGLTGPDKKKYIFNSTILDRLKGNMWVKISEEKAPSNLVVRQLCLIDLVEMEQTNRFRIQRLVYRLAPYSGELWAEGYSYWEYTRNVLNVWADVFKDTPIRLDIIHIDNAFINSAWIKDGKRYPAPFGDLREVPLREDLQEHSPSLISDIFVGKFLKKHNKVYKISPYILGGNTHTPKRNRVVRIIDEKPIGFQYYNGYDKKYRSKREEWTDILSRIIR